MTEFPRDAPKREVLQAFAGIGFEVVREREHISLARTNPDGSRTPLTIPNHPRIKASTLRTALARAGISREDFLHAYYE